MADPINPAHYRWMQDAIGVQPKDIAGLFPYHVGTALVYLMRAGRKRDEGESIEDAAIRDITKAIKHCEFEVQRLERERWGAEFRRRGLPDDDGA